MTDKTNRAHTDNAPLGFTSSEKSAWSIGYEAGASIGAAVPSVQAATRDWVQCPVCGEPDMLMTGDTDGNVLVFCTNHICASNGGDNSSALAAPGAAVAQGLPKGMVLVPVEPTREMMVAVDDAYGDGGDFSDMWEAALAAAPSGDAKGAA